MSADDLIYDILVRTIELRARLVVFRCLSDVYGVSESSPSISSIAYDVLNKMMNRPNALHEELEAKSSVACGDHLIALVEIQKERFQVWKAMLEDQLPIETDISRRHYGQPNLATYSKLRKFRSHRDAMNYLYYLLCCVIVEETKGFYKPSVYPTHLRNESEQIYYTDLVNDSFRTILTTIDTIDFAQSNLFDVYTFSLTEVLLQVALTRHSPELVHYILDIIWPQLEKHGRGYEHSHCPTHIAKRLIALIADERARDRTVLHVIPAIPEDTAKVCLMDFNRHLNMVIFGCDLTGGFYIEKTRLQ
jgi:hypothetical protein